MAGRIDDDFMTAEHDGQVVATARYSEHAAADGCGAWIVSFRPSLCRAGTRTMPLSWYFLCSSGRSPILVDQAADDLPARDPAGHAGRLAGFM
jgi:hypothetical protein